MVFYVVRHGQTDFNKLGVYQGRKDIPLNDIGVEQAKEMSMHLKKIVNEKNIDAIIVSPLIRAIQTADPVARLFGVEPVICDGIIERSFGNLEGEKPRPELTNQMMLDYNKNYSNENIEPIQDLFKRVYSTMDSIVDKYEKVEKNRGQEVNVVIVTHAAVTIAIECYFNGEPEVMNYETLEPLVLKNAQVRKYKK